MANILFPAATVGIMVLPLMVFHQVQLMTCAVLAKGISASSGATGGAQRQRAGVARVKRGQSLMLVS